MRARSVCAASRCSASMTEERWCRAASRMRRLAPTVATPMRCTVHTGQQRGSNRHMNIFNTWTLEQQGRCGACQRGILWNMAPPDTSTNSEGEESGDRDNRDKLTKVSNPWTAHSGAPSTGQRPPHHTTTQPAQCPLLPCLIQSYLCPKCITCSSCSSMLASAITSSSWADRHEVYASRPSSCGSSGSSSVSVRSRAGGCGHPYTMRNVLESGGRRMSHVSSSSSSRSSSDVNTQTECITNITARPYHPTHPTRLYPPPPNPEQAAPPPS